MSLHDSLYEWSRWIWPLVLNHLWQSTVFFGLAVVAARLLGRGRARTRYALWLATSLKFALPSALLIFVAGQLGPDTNQSSLWTPSSAKIVNRMYQIADPVPYAAPPRVACPLDPAVTCPFYDGRDGAEGATASPAGATVAAADQTHDGCDDGAQTGLVAAGEIGVSDEPASAHSELYCWLTLIWAAGFLLCIGRWFKRRTNFARRLRAGRVMTSGREVEALRRVQLKFGSVRVRKLVLLPGTTEPGVWRTFAPVVALPEDLASHLTDQELEAVLIHELVHVSRRDNLVGNLQMLLCCLLWFCPFIWLVDRSLLNERERTCDEEVIEMGMPCNVYAASLLKVLRFCSGWKMAGVSAATGSTIRSRVSAIVSERRKSRPRIWSRLALSSIAAGVILFSVVTGVLGESIDTGDFVLTGCEGGPSLVMTASTPAPDGFGAAVSEACSIRESAFQAALEEAEELEAPNQCQQSVRKAATGQRSRSTKANGNGLARQNHVQNMPGPVAK